MIATAWLTFNNYVVATSQKRDRLSTNFLSFEGVSVDTCNDVVSTCRSTGLEYGYS